MTHSGDDLHFAAAEIQTVDSFRRRTDTAVLTIMFTDIEGFTELTDREGEEHSNRVRRLHDTLLDGIITRGGAGLIVKRIGDAIMAVFAEPSTAVERALEIQEALDGFNEEHTEFEPLRVRIGLDMGQVTVEDHVDADVFGRHVNRASRVEGLGAGGQVYLSYTVFDSARGWLSDASNRFEWTSHGRYRLKGVVDPVEVFEVVDPTRRSLAPPRGGDRVRGMPSLVWAAGFVLLGIVGTVAYSQWEATSVYLSDINVESPYLDFATPLALDGSAEDESRQVMLELRPGPHVVHYDVADAVRYYAELDVQRGENRIRPAWEESRIPTISRRIELGDTPVEATREGTFFVYGRDNTRLQRHALLEISMDATQAESDPDELVVSMTWRVTLDGEVVSAGGHTYRNTISTRDDITETIELYADEHHRYWAEVRLVQRFGELDIWAAFSRPGQER